MNVPIAARVLLLLALVLWHGAASADWSIVAVDRQTRQIGAAGATCGVGLELGLGLLPGRGVVLSQADASTAGLERAVQRLEEGVNPAEIIREIASEEFDPPGWFGGSWQSRQYAIAALDLLPPVSAFTGTATLLWSGASAGRYFAVQGNGLVGEGVLARTIEAFDSNAPARAGPCRITLADRLIRGLEAGANVGGDARCGARAASSAFLIVANEGDSPERPWLEFVVPQRFGRLAVLWHSYFPYEPEAGAPPAVRALRLRYAEWLAGNPPLCPEMQ